MNQQLVANKFCFSLYIFAHEIFFLSQKHSQHLGYVNTQIFYDSFSCYWFALASIRSYNTDVGFFDEFRLVVAIATDILSE